MSVQLVRNIAGIVTGVAVANLIVATFEWAGHAIFGGNAFDPSFDQDALKAWVATIPLPLKLVVVAGWSIASVAGPWLTLRVTDRCWTGWVAATLFLAANIVNLMSMPHPAWMTVSGLALPVVGGWLAQRLHRKPYAGEALFG